MSQNSVASTCFFDDEVSDIAQDAIQLELETLREKVKFLAKENETLLDVNRRLKKRNFSKELCIANKQV